MLEAIRRVDPRDVSTYPSYPELMRACARHFGVDPEWILLTNGLDEGILMAAVGHIARARMSRRRDDRAAAGVRSVSERDRRRRRHRDSHSSGTGYVFQTDAVLRAITPRTRMIFLNTPNNPTGQLIALADLRRIADAAPHAIVLVDEAYIEFGGETFLPELAALSERADRPDVLEGLRPRRHARRHRHRPAAGARSGARW